jgi:hypothetical protein
MDGLKAVTPVMAEIGQPGVVYERIATINRRGGVSFVTPQHLIEAKIYTDLAKGNIKVEIGSTTFGFVDLHLSDRMNRLIDNGKPFNLTIPRSLRFYSDRGLLTRQMVSAWFARISRRAERRKEENE